MFADDLLAPWHAQVMSLLPPLKLDRRAARPGGGAAHGETLAERLPRAHLIVVAAMLATTPDGPVE